MSYPSKADVNKIEISIGRIIRRWAIVEKVLFLHLQAFLGCDQFRTRAIWESLPNMRARRQLLGDLATAYLVDHQQQEYNSLLKRLKKFSEKRNAFAHRLMMGTDDPKIVHFIADKRDNELGYNYFNELKFSIEQIEEIPTHIEQLERDLSVFLGKIEVYAEAKMHRGPTA